MSAKNDQANMSLVGHLREIRNRIALSVTALVVAFIACFAIIKPLGQRHAANGFGRGFPIRVSVPVGIAHLVFQAGAGAGDRGGFAAAGSLKSGALVAPALTPKRKAGDQARAAGRLLLLLSGRAVQLHGRPAVHDSVPGQFQHVGFHQLGHLRGSYLDFMIGMLADLRRCV